MKDYFSVTFTQFLNNDISNIKDVYSILKPKGYINSYDGETEKYFYAFDNTQGIDVSFAFFDNTLKSYISNDDYKLLNKIEMKYNIKNNLSFYYENLVIQGKVFKDIYYIYNVLYIGNNYSPGLYETKKILSLLEIPGPQVLFTKIKPYDIIDVDNKGMILTQQDGVDYSERLFIQI